MTAVAPETSMLSPFVGEIERQVRLRLAALLDIDEADVGPLRKAEGGLSASLTRGGRLEVDNIAVDKRRSSGRFSVRIAGADVALQSRVRAALARPRDLLDPALQSFAAAVDTWWPYAGIDDEEYRKVSSSPEGAYGTLRLGFRCNQDCWFCWQDRDGPAPPPAQFEVWLDELAAMGIKSVNFTGGEATTWVTLPGLVRRASGLHGMAVSLQTNGVRLAKAAYTAELVRAGLRAAMFSFHSAEAEVSDVMTRAPGTHQRTVEGVRQALGQGLYVTLTCVVEAANVDGLDRHADFVIEHFLKPFPANPIRRVTYAHPTDYFDPGRWRDQQVPFDVLRPRLSVAVARLRAAGIPVQVGGPCGFPICALDRELVGDPYRVVLRSGFHESELIHRRFGSTCSGCLARNDCFGLRQEYLDRFGERGLLPVKALPSS